MTYIVKKIMVSILTLISVTIIVFFAFNILPSNPVIQKLGIVGANNTKLIQSLEKQYNLDKSPIKRYEIWVSGIINGNMGKSISYPTADVTTLINDRIGVTLLIDVTSIIISIIVAIPITLYIAINTKSKISRFLRRLAILGISLPSFWISTLLIVMFCMIIPIFSITNGSIVLPIIALSIPNISLIIKYLLSSISQEVKKDYVIFLKTKGLTTYQIIKNHVLKNSLIPVITILGMIFMSILTGSVIVENVFSINGLGKLMVTASANFDYPLIQGIVIYYTVIIIVVTILIDICYYLVDKRISIS